MESVLCACGCGSEVNGGKTYKRGHHVRMPWYIRGKAGRKRVTERHKVDPVTGCWVWQLAIHKDGYGYDHRDDGTTTSAYLVSYMKHRGSIPDGLELDHTCRNRACINPDHLEPVTGKVNVRRSSKTLLNEEKVREIRGIWAQRSASQTDLAMMFGVTSSCIWSVVHRVTWKDVLDVDYLGQVA